MYPKLLHKKMFKSKLKDTKDSIACKKRKCELILLNQQQNANELTEIRKDIKQMKLKQALFISKIGHPLFINLHQKLLDEIIDICISYSNMTVCSMCRNCFPSQMCRDNGKESDCFRHPHFFTYRIRGFADEVFHLTGDVCINDKNQTIFFTHENDKELWKYLISFHTNQNLFFGRNHNNKSNFKINISLDMKSECFVMTLVDKYFQVYFKSEGIVDYDKILQKIKIADVLSLTS